jgi:predicted membrane chloride channel (bestrophin family)
VLIRTAVRPWGAKSRSSQLICLAILRHSPSPMQKVLQARSLASIAGTYIYPVDPQAAVLVVRYLSILGWSLKAQLRGESDAYQQEYLHSMLNQMRTTEGTSSSAGANTTNVEGGESEGAWLSKQSKQSVAITTRLRKICAVALSTPPTSSMDIMNPSTQLIIEERIRELETVVGVCERLFGSTIPPTYTRHLSRVMSLWLLLLPVSLIAINLKTVGVAFATTIAAYVFIGLDEVGMEIENVFQLLPLQQLAAATQKDVQDQFFMTVRA